MLLTATLYLIERRKRKNREVEKALKLRQTRLRLKKAERKIMPYILLLGTYTLAGKIYFKYLEQPLKDFVLKAFTAIHTNLVLPVERWVSSVL